MTGESLETGLGWFRSDKDRPDEDGVGKAGREERQELIATIKSKDMSKLV